MNKDDRDRMNFGFCFLYVVLMLVAALMVIEFHDASARLYHIEQKLGITEDSKQ